MRKDVEQNCKEYFGTVVRFLVLIGLKTTVRDYVGTSTGIHSPTPPNPKP